MQVVSPHKHVLQPSCQRQRTWPYLSQLSSFGVRLCRGSRLGWGHRPRVQLEFGLLLCLHSRNTSTGTAYNRKNLQTQAHRQMQVLVLVQIRTTIVVLEPQTNALKSRKQRTQTSIRALFHREKLPLSGAQKGCDGHFCAPLRAASAQAPVPQYRNSRRRKCKPFSCNQITQNAIPMNMVIRSTANNALRNHPEKLLNEAVGAGTLAPYEWRYIVPYYSRITPYTKQARNL